MQSAGSSASHEQVQLSWQVPPKAPQAEPGGSHCSPGSRTPLLQRPFNVVLVVLDDVVVEVVVVVVTQVPSAVGFFTLKRVGPLFVRRPVVKATLYESPPVRVRSAQPPVPLFGGRMESVPSLLSRIALIWKTPLPDFLICAVLTAPLSPFGSLYL